MALSKEEVLKIANLARLSLTEAEVEKYSKDLNQILGYVEQLQELDTNNIEPMVGAVNHSKTLREDISRTQDTSTMLANAPDSEGTAIKVPQMS